MIPEVVVIDLMWACMMLFMHFKSPTKQTRKLTLAAFAYVLVEAALHGPMEAFAAQVMGLLF